MAISDFISTSFLFSIAIIVILIGGIFAYVSYRMSEQDHKLTSMLGLVSTLAEEMHSLKTRKNDDSIVLNAKGDEEADDDSIRKEIHIFDQNMLSGGTDINLISVSDNESDNESDSESDLESDSESDNESDNSSNDNDSNDSDDLDLVQEPANNVKILNISAVNELAVNDFVEDLAVDDLAELNELLEDLEVFDTKSIHLDEPIESLVSDSILDISELKTIMMSDKPDYKKMGLNKLREVVVERSIISVLEAGKLKKPELLKLLGDKE